MYERDEQMSRAMGKTMIVIPVQCSNGTFEKRYADLLSKAPTCARCGEAHTYAEYEIVGNKCPNIREKIK